jgi:hypothetical protein
MQDSQMQGKRGEASGAERTGTDLCYAGML